MGKTEASLGGILGLLLGLIIQFAIPDGTEGLTGFAINLNVPIESQIDALLIKGVIVIFMTAIGVIFGNIVDIFE